MRSAPARAADASSQPVSDKGGRKWFGRVLQRREPAPAAESAQVLASDGLDAFVEENTAAAPTVVTKPPVAAPRPPDARGRTVDPKLVYALVAAIAVVVITLATAGGPRWLRFSTPTPPQGKLTVTTVPAGAEVEVDGKLSGLTPLTLSVGAGSHTVVLRRGTDERTLPVTVNANAEISQYVEFAAAAPLPPPVGRIAVTTEPAGARISVDGRVKGNAPLMLADLAAGEHTVSVAGESGPIERKVVVEAGGTTSVVFSIAKTGGPASGWLAVSSPFELQIFEGNDLIGTSGASRIMLQAGRHDFRLVNQNLGYEDTRRIEVGPGKVAAVKIDAPKAAVSANARPWADVIVDGVNVGQTPLANLSLAIGTHQVIFRHPQLGERKQTAVVTVKGPNRISADMTKP